VLSHYPIRQNSGCSGIVAANGLIYYTELNAGKLGAMSTSGFTIDAGAYTQPGDIAQAADGRLWFAEFGAHAGATVPVLGNAPPAASFPMPTPTGKPEGIALGPDDRVWFTESNIDEVAACDPGGTTCVGYPVPPGTHPLGIVAGPDGNLWIAEYSSSKIGRMSVGGTLTEFPTPTPASKPFGITRGPDGALWFVENAGNRIGRITTSGTITEYPIPTANASAQWITLGPDGNLWFTETGKDQLGRVVVFIQGDADGDGDVDVNDVFYLINFLFAGGPVPK
jgi:virginiamycin B lyase